MLFISWYLKFKANKLIQTMGMQTRWIGDTELSIGVAVSASLLLLFIFYLYASIVMN